MEGNSLPGLKNNTASSLSTAGLGNLLIVYLIWSSTYLVIRVMVRPGSGISVWTAGSYRVVIAGLILLIYALIRHYRIKITLREMACLLITGWLMWIGSNGVVMWIEQRANSGFVALALGSTPIWSAFIEAIFNRKMPSRMLVGALFLSFSGIICLVVPSLMQGNTTQLGDGLIVILASAAWALASVLQNRWQIQLEAPVMAAYQHLLSGIGFITIAILTDSTWTQATPTAWMALVYLIIFGSVIAFTSFINALKLLPINIAMTYAFVNPVLAQILGWWILGEPLTIWTLIGTTLVIMGVVIVFSDKKHPSQEEKLRISGVA